MRALEFLETAEDLLRGSREADWRSSVSRAYYAVFNRLCEIFVENIEPRLLAPSGATRKPPHGFVKRCLLNSHDYDPQASQIGKKLDELRIKRNDADYDLASPLARSLAVETFDEARDLSVAIEDLSPIRIGQAVSEVLKVSPYGHPPAS